MIDSDLIPTGDDVPKLVRQYVLAQWLGVHPTTIIKWVKAGRLPQPVRLSPGMVFFHVAKLRKWLRQKEQEAADLDARFTTRHDVRGIHPHPACV